MKKKYIALRIKKADTDTLHSSGFHFISIDGELPDGTVEHITSISDVVMFPQCDYEGLLFGCLSIDIPKDADYLRLFSAKFDFEVTFPVGESFRFNLV